MTTLLAALKGVMVMFWLMEFVNLFITPFGQAAFAFHICAAIFVVGHAVELYLFRGLIRAQSRSFLLGALQQMLFGVLYVVELRQKAASEAEKD